MDLTATSKIGVFKLMFFYFLFQIKKTEGYSHLLTCNLPDHKTTPGSNLMCSCQVDITKSGNKDALWYRLYGQTKQIIGINHQIDYQFQSKRYTLSYKQSTVIHAIYILRIENLMLHDGMTIQCISPISRALTPLNTFSLAVCNNVNSSFCDCLSRKGWASPKCHEDKVEADRHAESLRRACVIIGILMAIVLLISILITVKMLHRDIKKYIEDKRDKRLQQQTFNETNNENLSTPPQSILKKTSKNTSVQNNDPTSFINGNKECSASGADIKNNSFSSNDSDSTFNKSDKVLEQHGNIKSRYQVEYNHPSTIQPINHHYIQKEVGFHDSENENYNDVNAQAKNETSAISSHQKTKKTNKKNVKKTKKLEKPDEAQQNTQKPYNGTEI